MKNGIWAAALLLCVIAAPVFSQEAKQPWEEYDKLIKTREAVTALGPTLLGDQVNLSNGSLSFSSTDVSVPGNSALPVALTRTLAVSNRKGYRTNDLPFADWDIDVPRISGVFRYTPPNGGFGTACAVTDVVQARPPMLVVGSSQFPPEDYWQGNQASMPGGGEMLLVRPGVTAPTTGGPYYWMTSNFTYFSCLASIKNGAGEGFLATTAEGTKYWFDWMASFHETDLKSGKGGSDRIGRSKRVLYATRVEDRFGNWVTYTYANGSNGPGRLTGISASDGRSITIDYNAQGHVSLVTSGSQWWSYLYDYSNPEAATLTSVTLPDTSKWSIAFGGLATAKIRYEQPHCTGTGINQICDVVRSCGDPGSIITPGALGTITHPSGATGEFSVEPIRHGRSNVPMVCSGYSDPYNDPNDDSAYYPVNYDAFTLTKKRITGPGLTAAEWIYTYYSDASFAAGTGPVCYSGNCGAPICTSDSCAGTAATVVTGPDNEWTRHTFGNSYRYNEGKLLKVERGTGPQAISKTEATSYVLATSGQVYPTPIGTSPQPRGDGFTSEYLLPQLMHVITQDGATFNSLVNGFDALARPISVGNWSSLGNPGRTQGTEYYDDLSKWVIGQIKRSSNVETGIVMSQTDYWPSSALPQRTWAFGKAQQYFEYNADGTIATVTDGNNNTTRLSSWKRGVPQTIQHADNTTESATVNDFGWVTSATDENGFATGYGYDAMGRLASIVYPTGDSTAWSNVTMSFQQINAPERGLPEGHWRQDRYQGNRHTATYMDALWRPVMTLDYDLNGGPTWNVQGQTINRYDAGGRLVFQSYPTRHVGDFNQALSGTHTTYDGLDRVTQVKQDSELGQLTTTTEYLPGFQRRITNPRLFVTTQTFHAYDVPTYDMPSVVDAPGGVKTVVKRDYFGKPTEVTRSGPDG